MTLEQALISVIAVAVPVWLVVEQLLVRRRSAKERRVLMTLATREKAVLRPAVRLLQLPQKVA